MSEIVSPNFAEDSLATRGPLPAAQTARALPRVALRLPCATTASVGAVRLESPPPLQSALNQASTCSPTAEARPSKSRVLESAKNLASDLTKKAVGQPAARKRSISMAVVRALALTRSTSPWQKLRAMGYFYLMMKQPQVWLAAVAAMFVQLAAALIFSQPAEPKPDSAPTADVVMKVPAASDTSAKPTVVVAEPQNAAPSASAVAQADEAPEASLSEADGDQRSGGQTANASPSSPVYEVARHHDAHPESATPPPPQPGVATLREPEAAAAPTPEQDQLP